MTRNILIAFAIMIIALVGLSVASAADNGTVDDVEINDIDNVVVVDDTADSIADVNDVDEIAADDPKPVMRYDDVNSIQTEPVDGDNELVDNQTEPIVEYSEYIISNYDLINLYYDTSYNKHNELNVGYIDSVLDEINCMYEYGFRCKEIAEKVNMTVDQTQNVVDRYLFTPIGDDEFTYNVYRLYGSATIEEIAKELGAYNEQVLDKVMQINSGRYGSDYKRLFLGRDMNSRNEQLSDYIIGDI
ncbi:hypothetical protein [uncultured Methanobrevibacter sp.]|uniref:hypothetical protein n=1 Tax=uncultured Methanobrevibacter sp. TaxID=253161 RepID=UPI0025FA08A0|nr:hypothetical protein [uncultured Methanobrevibacter sp.]